MYKIYMRMRDNGRATEVCAVKETKEGAEQLVAELSAKYPEIKFWYE